MLEPTIFKTNSELESFVTKYWPLKEVSVIKHIDTGSANLYLIDSEAKYVFKEYESDISKENILKEISVVDYLRNKGIKVTKYIQTINSEAILDLDGRYYTLMTCLEGNSLENHSLDDENIVKVASSLAQINIALEDFPDLPLWGRAEDYDVKLNKLEKLIKNIQEGDNSKKQEFLEDLMFKKEVYLNLIKRDVDLTKFTYRNSNGDFSLRQMLFDNEMNVTGLLDFDRASRLPISWEILRSYIQSTVYSREGEINIESFCKYVTEYMKHLPLTRFDLENMAYLYILQLAPTTHGYNPELYELDFAKDKTYRFGKWRTKIVKWLYNNEIELSKRLVELKQ